MERYGDIMADNYFNTAVGSLLKGMEGKSIMPHYEVYQSVNDFMKNRDTVLEFALKMIETNNQ